MRFFLFCDVNFRWLFQVGDNPCSFINWTAMLLGWKFGPNIHMRDVEFDSGQFCQYLTQDLDGRLDHVDEVLRTSQLSCYLHTRTVSLHVTSPWISSNLFVEYVLKPISDETKWVEIRWKRNWCRMYLVSLEIEHWLSSYRISGDVMSSELDFFSPVILLF